MGCSPATIVIIITVNAIISRIRIPINKPMSLLMKHFAFTL